MGSWYTWIYNFYYVFFFQLNLELNKMLLYLERLN